MKKIYLAGPDVFKPERNLIGHALKAICEKYGCQGLWPFDNEATAASDIRAANEQMIRDCDGVLANITHFRGPGMDPGTAYEIGFARALGKPVALYSYVHSEYKERVVPDGMLVENFKLIDNLMVCEANKHIDDGIDDGMSFRLACEWYLRLEAELDAFKKMYEELSQDYCEQAKELEELRAQETKKEEP